jgi:hypothetical protein
MAQTLVKHASIAQLIVRLFFALFDPCGTRGEGRGRRGEIEAPWQGSQSRRGPDHQAL